MDEHDNDDVHFLVFDGRVPYIPSEKTIEDEYVNTEELVYKAQLSATYITSVNWKGINQPFLADL